MAAKVFSSGAEEVVLIVPKFSKLAESVDNFKFLKQGLEGVNKILLVESVDEKVIKMATQAKISAQNPFFKAPEESIEELSEEEEPAEIATEEAPEEEAQAGSDSEEDNEYVGDNVFRQADEELEKSFSVKEKTPRKIIIPSGRQRMAILVVFVFASLGLWAGAKILPQAEIKIIAKKFDWQFDDRIVIDKNASAGDLAALKIPGQLFSQKKNSQLSFPASSKKFIKEKAKGKILIYNAYSSSPQPLVANTRFQSSDGKLVRLDEAVTVPAAKIVDGEIVPSFMEANITADQAGEKYNIGPIAKLTVPGFKNSPKYNGFYGEIKSPLKGGYNGERAFPTSEDIEKSKSKGGETLKEALNIELTAKVPKDFKIIAESERFRILKEEVNANVDSENNFSLFTEAEMSIMAFRESDLLAALENKAKEHFGKDFEIKSHALEYKMESFDLTGGRLTMAVNFKAVVSQPIDYKNLREKIAGKTESDLRALIFSLSNLDSAKISLWPFWVSRVPKNEEKIKISVD